MQRESLIFFFWVDSVGARLSLKVGNVDVQGEAGGRGLHSWQPAVIDDSLSQQGQLTFRVSILPKCVPRD